MIRSVGRAQLIGIAAILALFFVAEFAMKGIYLLNPVNQAEASTASR